MARSFDSTDTRKSRGKKFEAPPDFDGPTEHRSCTDILFALIMLSAWLGMTGVGKLIFILF
jgi:hypothetical protein